MDVRFITSAGVESCDPAELPDLLSRTEGLVWVDMPTCDSRGNVDDGPRVSSARHPRLGEPEPGAEDSPLRRPSIPGAAYSWCCTLRRPAPAATCITSNSTSSSASTTSSRCTVRSTPAEGTIEFYQARTNTKMTIAAERLAVIAAVTLPITALSSVLGVNLIVNQETHWLPVTVMLVVMLAMSATLLVWAKRKGWF
jgi:hypothetical protein